VFLFRWENYFQHIQSSWQQENQSKNQNLKTTPKLKLLFRTLQSTLHHSAEWWVGGDGLTD